MFPSGREKKPDFISITKYHFDSILIQRTAVSPLKLHKGRKFINNKNSMEGKNKNYFVFERNEMDEPD